MNVEARSPNDNNTRRQIPTLGRAVALAFVMLGLGLTVGACGGGSALGVASVGSSTITEPKPAGAAVGNGGGITTAKYRAALAYVSCMRSHGEPDFPDPTAGGTLNVTFVTGGKGGAPVSNGIDRNSPQYISADKACVRLRPGGVTTAAQTRRALAEALKFAECMRSHGVPNFPDPNPTNPGVVHLVGVDPTSPEFQRAQKTCETLVPGSGAK